MIKPFKTFFKEDSTVGAGSLGAAAAIGHGGDVPNTDFYAKGDSRIPKVLGAKRKGRRKGKRKGRRKGKRKSKTPMQRRSFTKM